MSRTVRWLVLLLAVAWALFCGVTAVWGSDVPILVTQVPLAQDGYVAADGVGHAVDDHRGGVLLPAAERVLHWSRQTECSAC